ncbi:Ribulose-5-phosphate 4-epimerase/Fuculose-1-phosphate aldolase [Arboricoccus pini]|uniref:Ribulose-5-phosphate 4-epimerase/Fuculose-1-phosphate aldolase n=1 Tax=Arboricoccus pini TaxID=1963835 RepID=A0A212RJD0_9PROT|nr:class II aldolase/adducin family protein [Arboricoccus pini]SNB72512.1 Ribulose-5-phosphate 4-epimerase/Fuculose-1-phosphate aldolase [Arboricoccus pini]
MAEPAFAPRMDMNERQLRIDLAAAFRLVVREGWHEAVANHFSVALSADGHRFLLNPQWVHFATLRASDLVLLDAGMLDEGGLPANIDATAWTIHGTMHAKLPQARCILHLHPPYATALSCLADPDIKPIDQTTARFFRRLAIDLDYGGMADEMAEGLRLVQAMGDKRTMMMGNHGVLATGETVAEAFDSLYHLERACRTLMLAYASGKPLNVLGDEVAEKTARSWDHMPGWAEAHFAQMKRLLDRDEPDYAD